MKKKFQWWQVNTPFSQLDDADYRWCCDLMGEPCYTARWWYEQESNKFYFKNQKDAMLFEIMWSGHESKDK